MAGNRQGDGYLKIFVSYYKPHWKLFLLDMVCALCICIVDLLFPMVSRWSMQTLLPERLFTTFFAVMALLAGAVAGCVTGLLQTRWGIHPILAGILTMSGLYTINITVMGSPNISLINSNKFFTFLEDALTKDGARYLTVGVIVLLCVGLLALFFKTSLGLCIRATGNNEAMVRASSINPNFTKMVALALSNGLVALSGGVLAQCQGYADINSGSGMIVIGLASVIIGEVFFGRRSILLCLISAVVGSVVYRIIIALALQLDLFDANALKLISAVIVAVTLAVPAFKTRFQNWRTRREAGKHA